MLTAHSTLRRQIAIAIILRSSCCLAAIATFDDADYDVLPRPSDAGRNAGYDLDQHRAPNLLDISLATWQADAPADDLFEGDFSESGDFLRIDIRLEGLINPPGNTKPEIFEPFRFGQHPIYGFLEIDVDDNKETGGELEAPQFRYLANIARFGGIPESSDFDDRIAHGGEEIDDDFLSPPYVERHGEEFHVAFLGDQFDPDEIASIVGNADAVFEAGERWQIPGRWLHRAHGFEPYSVAFGGLVPGEYLPYSAAQFAHDQSQNTTTISIIAPLTNQACAAVFDESPEALNHDTSDQTSILEALFNLITSADIVEQFPTGEPQEVLIQDWSGKDPGDFLDPSEWRVTALVGASYDVPVNGFVWTDALPNAIRGDVNGENGADVDDREEIEEFIEDHDADDGVVDGSVSIPEFAADFWVYDLNYDGVVDASDIQRVSPPGDVDLDEDVDLADFAEWQHCVGQNPLTVECSLTDIDGDWDADTLDYRWFPPHLTGPSGL